MDEIDLEDAVVDALWACRGGGVDETVIRRRWQTLGSDTPTAQRVSDLLCGNGPDYHFVMNELRSAGHVT